MIARELYQELVVDYFIKYNKDIVTEMELLFLMNSNPELKSLIKIYKEKLLQFHWDEISLLKTTILNIKKEQKCSHSNQSQTPK